MSVNNYVKAAYEAGRARKMHEFENEQKITADDINWTTGWHSIEFDFQRIPCYLRFRSGLQFLIESPEHLKDEYEDDEDFKNNIEDLDEGFKRWKADEYDYPFVGPYFNHTKTEVERPDDIPERHWWWWTENEKTSKVSNETSQIPT